MSFSVIIPCHNAGQFIGTAIKSVLGQTLAAKEIIVINDGSTDNSASVLAEFAGDITLLETQVCNGAASRNIAVGEATGDWVAFLDADDLWYPDHLERVSLAVAQGSTAFANRFDHMTCESEDTQANAIPASWPQQTTHQLSGNAFLEFFLAAPWFPGMSALAFQRSEFLSCGGLEEEQIRRHDIELWIRFLADPKNSWTLDNSPSSAYRVDSPGSLSRNKPSKDRFMFKAFFRNRDRFLNPCYLRLLQRYARRCIATALTHGTPGDIKVAYQVASSELALRDKVLFGFGHFFPNWFASIIRAKRRIT